MNGDQLTSVEQQEFLTLMSRSYKKVYHLAYRLSGNRSDAEDLTQETFFRAYRGFHGYQGDKPFENWVLRITTRLFLDQNRARKRRVQTISSDAPVLALGSGETYLGQVPDPSPTPENEVVDSRFSEDLEEALSQLKPEQRALVLMSAVDQIPYDELAVELGIPPGTVRSRLHRAHKRLRQILDSRRTTPGLNNVVQSLRLCARKPELGPS